MPNRNYVNGRAKEYSIVNKYRKLGFDIVFRSAGSHSPIDIVAVHHKNKIIKFIQVKPKRMSKNMSDKIYKENDWLTDEFRCEFVVITNTRQYL